MHEHNITPNYYPYDKDTNSNTLNPVFDLEKIGIDKIAPTDALQHMNKLLERSNDAETLNKNTFPIDVFPRIFRDVISECEKSLNFPTDYTGTAILTAVSTAIGTSAKIKVKKGWYEFAALYAAIVGNAGANKSHPLSFVFDALNKIDCKAIEEYKVLYEEFEEYQLLSKKDKKEKSKINKPILIKSILHNFTPEILHQRLSDNIRGCAVVSDELATFLEGMNNYSKGDQASVYLSFWSNKSTSIDRVSKPIPLYIQLPFLNIIGSLQPRVLPKLFPSNKADNGTLQRFLFAFPDALEKQPINDNEMNEDVLNRYNDWINQYIFQHQIKIDFDSRIPQSKIYNWSNDAKIFFYEWQRLNTIEVNKNQTSLKGEIISKFDIHFSRLALILQVMEDCDTNLIGLNAVHGAAKLCSYFQKNAMKVLDILENPIVQTDVLPINKQKFLESLPIEFTTDMAVKNGVQFDIRERTVKSFLNDKDFFEKISYGTYKKKN